MVIVGDSVLSRRIPILLLAVIVLLGVGAWSPSHAQSCPCTIWTPSTVPGTANANDPRSVEVGVKFRSDVAGFVTAVRFYKGSQNTGTHTGSLWAAGGALLGRVTFTNETASGWQQATFATPIAIAANTTYVASYFAPVGRYSFNSQYFQTATDRPPLHALANSVSANGVFRYAGSPAFPNQTFNASNYWVDVVFTTSTGPDVTPPTVTSVTPANGASSVNVGTTVTATFSEPMNATTINTDTFQLESAAGPMAGTVTYNATTRVATLTPGSALATGTAYTATVRGGLTDPRVKDVAGNALASSMTWSFTTAATTDTTPPTVTSVSPAGGATNVDTATTVTATFSEAMDATTISGDTFQLRDPGNTLISALVTYNATTRVATLAPSGALAQATTYTATVRGGTTDPRVKDVAGNALATSSVWSFTTSGGGGTPCTANPIVCENQKPGNPDTDWDVAGAGDPSIQGFATDISVNKGQTVRFKISTGASAYRLDIYRMGFYGGNGARRVATIRPSIPLPQSQPPCLSDGATGLVDCGNWAESVSWPVPADATSGIYFAKLVRESGAAGSSHIVFIVRDDAGQAPILFQTSDTTWQAYNQYGGNSLYVGSPAGRAYKVSYNRPFTTRGTSPEDWVFNAEYPMVRWLEANGYHVSYFTGVDTDRIGTQLTQHRLFLSVGHDEYWSGNQRTNVEAARNAGVHLAFFSGNEVFWKTRWENSIDASQTPYRTLVCYKETHDGAKIDPLPNVWTGTWRDPRFSPPADGGRPENALTGTLFTVNDGATTSITVSEPFGKLRFWRNTSIATLGAGQTATLPNGTLGYEWDEDVDNGVRPPGLIQLSSTTRDVPGKLQDFGSSYSPGTVTHSLTLYRHPSGALVFGAGTVQWSWGLDSNHDRGSANPDVRMQQATVNLFADMGQQPATLQPGLVATTASTDTTPPSSTITSPQAGASLPAGQAVTISGTATDTGGLVAGVEVSVDNGTTWRRATGRATWTFAWTPAQSGTFTIRSRATDDSARTETPSAGITVTVGSGGGGGTCPCSLWVSTDTPAVASHTDTSAVELGVKFRADVDGVVTGIRFYKGTQNTGTHVGNLWTLAGQRLATVTFTNETASGWQQANFATPVAITANTTYVASYHAPVGRYAVNQNYFATTGVDRAPLHAPATFVAANGVFRYGASAFPTDSFAASNYWVDVVFTPAGGGSDTTPPTVTAVSPASDASGVALNTTVTATFSEAMDASTISTSTFELRGPSNTLVGASVAYDAATRVATLTPTSALAATTLYTATVLGGTTDPRVKDLAGNALAANRTWSFTTGSSAPPPSGCPCTIWASTATPATASVSDGQAVELGVKFRSDVAGFVTGIRFYKGAQNTGTHVGKLWSSTGQLLGSATFTNETASGWQQVNFASPVAITANTTYVASYHTTSGFYAANGAYFASTGTDRPPLHALATTVSPNGVYAYGAGGFPSQTFNATNYWVDVVFDTTGGSTPSDTTPPTVAQVSPSSGAGGVSTTANVIVTFSEAMDPATITSSTVILRNAGNTAVAAAVTYDPSTFRATIDPTDQLTASATYTVEVRGGATDPRVKDVAGNALATTFTSTFATGSSGTPPPPGQGPGGPILVVTAPQQNTFGAFYAEILTAEGLNAFAVADIATVTAAVLAQYDVVILAEMTLSSAQVSMLSDWVNTGGNLIAMRPDKQLATLLGLQDQAQTLANAYLLVDTSQPPGAGIVGETIQYHGLADRYVVNGATVIATLYASPSASTPNPAVTVRTVGALGQAAAFTYDLARSVVYTRQGNPDWSGEERDGTAPIRSDDLYFGNAAGDVQPDWVNLGKVAIPQADEQQRLLVNLILFMNGDRKPLPRFWYFPRGINAVVVMTGDDHGNGGTAGRFDQYRAASPAGCSVDNWECVRSSSYIYVGTPLTNAQAVAYESDGFEVGLHVNTGCADFTPSSLQAFYTDQLAAFATAYPGVSQPVTNRTHCIVWSDWATQAKVAVGHGIGLDANYYYWPPTWITDRPGFFTGSGMPMRFVDTDGTIIDVYQATTQMTDESGQTYPFTIDTLLDRALGTLGYYGVFTANMHTDSASHAGSDAIVASARARGVPIVSARQMLTWLDGRNGSSFANLTWNGTALAFSIVAGSGANGLQAMMPAASGGRTLTTITRDGSPVTFTTRTVKGIVWAVFPALPGSYQASYSTP